MLFILAMWRYVYKRFPLRYDPLYWGSDLPPGYVYCLYIPDGKGDGAGVSAGDSALFCLHSVVGLAGRLLRTGLQACVPPARFLKQARRQKP